MVYIDISLCMGLGPDAEEKEGGPVWGQVLERNKGVAMQCKQCKQARKQHACKHASKHASQHASKPAINQSPKQAGQHASKGIAI